MASTYSTSLRLELMGTGDQSGTWGTTTNTNLGTLLEQSITGYLSKAQGDVANLTLTNLNGGSDEARNVVLDFTGALTAARNVIVPTVEKTYLVKNSTTGGFALTIKTSAGTGVSLASGVAQWVYCDGTNVVSGLGGPLSDIQGLSVTDGNFIVGDGTNWVVESGSTALTSLGAVPLAGGTMTGALNMGGNALSNVATLNGGPLKSHNEIINGDFDVWQRGTSGFGHGVYSADRWTEVTNTDDVLSISRQSHVVGQTDVPGGPKYFLRASLTAGTTGTVNDFRTRIPNISRFAGKTFTLTQYVRGTIATDTGNNRYAFVFGTGGTPSATYTAANIATLAVTTSWQKFQDVVTFPSISGKTLGTNGDDYLDIILGFPINQTVDVDFSHISLVEGDATNEIDPFEKLSFGEVLARCQRYYEHLGYGGSGQAAATTTATMCWQFEVVKRVAPTVALLDTTPTIFETAVGIKTGSGSALGSTNIGVTGITSDVTGFTGLAAGNGALCAQDDIISADAEL